MFKATREEIKQTVRNIGIAQAYGVVSISDTNTAVSFLSMVAEAENMEERALELIASAQATYNTSYDMRTQSRMTTAIRKLEALFED
jgi:hypothetical protein